MWFALVCAVLFVMMPSTAVAIFYNDTQTIEIEDGMPPPPEGKGGEVIFTGGGGVWIPPNNPGSGSSQNKDAATNDSASAGGAPIAGGSVPSDESSEDEILSLLEKSGALTNTLGGGLGSVGGTAGGAGGEGSLRIVARSVRETLAEHFDLKEFLGFWRRASDSGLGGREYGLIAASTILRDSDVQEILFTASKVEITYRSRGYLLAVIPWTFPVTVGITPTASILEDRITVKLPWYRFFVREFFTVSGLQRELDEVLQTTLKDPQNQGDDVTALVFETTISFLKRKVGTVSDTVQGI